LASAENPSSFCSDQRWVDCPERNVSLASGRGVIPKNAFGPPKGGVFLLSPSNFGNFSFSLSLNVARSLLLLTTKD